MVGWAVEIRTKGHAAFSYTVAACAACWEGVDDRSISVTVELGPTDGVVVIVALASREQDEDCGEDGNDCKGADDDAYNWASAEFGTAVGWVGRAGLGSRLKRFFPIWLCDSDVDYRF